VTDSFVYCTIARFTPLAPWQIGSDSAMFDTVLMVMVLGVVALALGVDAVALVAWLRRPHHGHHHTSIGIEP